MNDSPAAAGAGSLTTIAAASAGGLALWKYAPSILSNLQNRITGGGTGTPPPNPPPVGSAAAGLARKAGVAGLVLSGGMLAKDLAEGDMEGASGMAGVIGGGLIGAKLGASVGALGGPIGVAIGGIIGSIGGSILGEEGVSSLYDWMFGDDDDTEEKANNQLQAISQGADTVHFQSEIDEPNNQIKALKDGTDTVVYDSEINPPNQIKAISQGADTVHYKSEIDEPNNQIKALKDGTDTVVYDSEINPPNQIKAISQGADTVHYKSEIDEPNNQIKALKDGTDTVVYDSEIKSPNQINQVSNGTAAALERYQAPHIKTEVSTLIEKSEMATSVITEKSMPQPIPIVLTINANVKADDNVTVSEDFEDKLIATLREATPELMMQLSQTLDDHILELS
ncbi:hypothetical protein [Shewanella halifaxensis]|uniref:hypothetical protein n=1 Tax=Shewanella halifaxensis TaxID=271098 RepID=UPI000D592820|nr:hypothetical protein [Shewanella halifaxensis]